MNEELIAPCGMNCAICSSYLAFKHQVKSSGVRMSYCTGCRPRNKQCAVLKKRCTLLAENKVQFCYLCPDYPCANLAHLDRRYRTFFRMSMIENLNLIKARGTEIFLAREWEKWSCPECGGYINCHNGICFSCHLEKMKTKRKKYRWEDDD